MEGSEENKERCFTTSEDGLSVGVKVKDDEVESGMGGQKGKQICAVS